MSGPKVFISYAKENMDVALQIYRDLKTLGARPWIDVEDLLPGTNWRLAIKREIEHSEYFLALMSSASVSKRGYVQRELKHALEVLEEIPETGTYIIPVRLDNCKPAGKKLEDIQWVDLFPYETGLPKLLRTLQLEDSSFAPQPIVDADMRNISEAGWGIIFPAKTEIEIKGTLAVLMDHRKSQATKNSPELYREFAGDLGYQQGDTARRFLARHGVGPGLANPGRVPYYLLIVADPEVIPFIFQYQLSLQYAVGRIHFDRLDEYANYARNIVDLELRSSSQDRSLTFFAPEIPNDDTTHLMANQLVRPLASNIRERYADWVVNVYSDESATKTQLQNIISHKRAPSMLFATAPGVAFPPGSKDQYSNQGAILCQDWPGPQVENEALSPDYYFSAKDVLSEVNLQGTVLLMLSSFSAGTDKFADSFPEFDTGKPRLLANRSFVSSLSKRILGRKPGGALSVIGHVNHAGASLFLWQSAGPQLHIFESVVARLMSGNPVGFSMNIFSHRYAELSSHLASLEEEKIYGAEIDKQEIYNIRRASRDARNYIVIGDPAVKCSVSET